MRRLKHIFKLGDIIGNSVFLNRSESRNGQPMAMLRCECGKKFETRIYSLISGKTKSCGCLQRKVAAIPKKEINVGDKINGFLYLGDAPYKPNFPRKANFKCVCGSTFVTTINSIENGTTKSCGCLTKYFLSKAGGNRENKIPMLSEYDVQRFWDKVNFSMDVAECWNWSATGQRYGGFRVKRKMYRANRIAFFISKKEDPSEFEVMHSCHNPKCCNPSHLSLGTHQENMTDMVLAGRSGKKLKAVSETLKNKNI